MNAQEIKNVAALISVFFGGIFAAHGATVSTAQITSFITDLSVAIPALISAGGAIYSVYTHWNMKKVPEKSVALMPTEPVSASTIANNIGTPVSVAGKVVGAILLGLLFAPQSSHAATSTACNLQTLFVGITAANFIQRLQGCGDSDIQAALSDANTAPVDNIALACFIPLSGIISAIKAQESGSAGLITAMQKFRRAKQSGFVGACTAWIQTTIALQ